jgi:hypothetical protein
VRLRARYYGLGTLGCVRSFGTVLEEESGMQQVLDQTLLVIAQPRSVCPAGLQPKWACPRQHCRAIDHKIRTAPSHPAFLRSTHTRN